MQQSQAAQSRFPDVTAVAAPGNLFYMHLLTSGCWSSRKRCSTCFPTKTHFSWGNRSMSSLMLFCHVWNCFIFHKGEISLCLISNAAITVLLQTCHFSKCESSLLGIFNLYLPSSYKVIITVASHEVHYYQHTLLICHSLRSQNAASDAAADKQTKKRPAKQ